MEDLLDGVPEPRFVATTLRWCNTIRREQGKEELGRLPKGRIGNPRSCPCGEAAEAFVNRTHYRLISDQANERRLPPAVAQFVHEFDQGNLPQYIDR